MKAPYSRFTLVGRHQPGAFTAPNLGRKPWAIKWVQCLTHYATRQAHNGVLNFDACYNTCPLSHCNIFSHCFYYLHLHCFVRIYYLQVDRKIFSLLQCLTSKNDKIRDIRKLQRFNRGRSTLAPSLLGVTLKLWYSRSRNSCVDFHRSPNTKTNWLCKRKTPPAALRGLAEETKNNIIQAFLYFDGRATINCA